MDLAGIRLAFASAVRAGMLPVALACLVAAANIAVLAQFDRTTYSTTNGIWKSASVVQWERGTGTPSDNGGWNYNPVVGYFCRAIPDDWVRFGSPAPSLTFRKMALMNCVLGGIAAGLVLVLARRASGSSLWAVAVAIMHATCAFVLVNSLNNEDILPAYVCLLAGTALLFRHADTSGAASIAAAALCFAFMTLLHWTMLPPALAAVGAMLAVLAFRNKWGWVSGVVFALVFAGGLWVLFLPPDETVTVMQVLYPSKAQGNAWVGFRTEKLMAMFSGIGFYFRGGFNINDYWAAFEQFPGMMITSLAAAVVGIVSCASALLSRKFSPNQRLLAGFGLTLFLAGQFENLYSQPQDPQMQLQPMLGAILGFGFLGGTLSRRLAPRTIALASGALVAVSLANGAGNVGGLNWATPPDGQTLRLIRAVYEGFPPDKVLHVTHGFDGWLAWEYAVNYQGDPEEWAEDSFRLVDTVSSPGSCDIDCAVERTWARIDEALCSGKKVYANVLWNQERETFAMSMVQLTSKDDAARYYDALRPGATLGERVEFEGIEFRELVRTPSCPVNAK